MKITEKKPESVARDKNVSFLCSAYAYISKLESRKAI